MKKFGEQKAWAYPGTAHFLGIPYFRNGKSYLFQIWSVYSEGLSEQNPIKILEKRERGCIQGLSNFFRVPPIISGRLKLRYSNFARTFISSIGPKPVKNFGKSSSGHSQGLPKFFRAPIHTYGASHGHLCDSSAFLLNSERTI